MLQGPVPGDVGSAFGVAESTYHEFGLPWLRNLAATALSRDESAWLYIARKGPSEFVALPLRLNTKDRSAHALSTWYSSLWSPVQRCGQPQPLYGAIFQHMARKERIVALTLSPMDPETAVFRDLEAALSASPWKGIHRWSCFANWIQNVTGCDYKTYLASRPSRVRNTVKRKTRGFLKAGMGELEIIEDIHARPETLEQFLYVYGNSWKPQEPFPQFIPGLLETASEKGWLRLGLARYEGKPIAVQIWLVANSTAAIFKLAYDSNYRSLSPGTVLTAYMMQHVIDIDGVDTIDYLTGDDDYKQDWMQEQRERRGIAGYNVTTIRGLAGWLSHRLKRRIKRTAGHSG